MRSEKEKKRINNWRFTFIVLALLSVMAPLISYWHIELAFDLKPNFYFTNGYILTPAVKMYHHQMWLVVFTSLASSMFIIYSVMNDNFLEKLKGGNEKWDYSKKKKIANRTKNFKRKR